MALIRNFGLFWRRTDIFWGKPRVNGHLKGYPARGPKSRIVDFREQQGVYCLYDDTFHLLYIGQAGANDQQRLFDRLQQHRKDALADRWTKFSWFGTRWATQQDTLAAGAQAAHPSMDEVLNHIEAILISAAEPPLNRQGGRWGPETEQYRQYRDDALGPSTDEMIRDVWKRG